MQSTEALMIKFCPHLSQGQRCFSSRANYLLTNSNALQAREQLALLTDDFPLCILRKYPYGCDTHTKRGATPSRLRMGRGPVLALQGTRANHQGKEGNAQALLQ